MLQRAAKLIEKGWLYWPSSPEYAVPWLLGPAIFLVFSFLGLPGGKPVTLATIAPTTSSYSIFMLASATLGGLLFWTHVRTQFLTWKTALRPFLVTYLLITVANLTIWGLILRLRGEARLALANDANFDPILTSYVIALGLAGQLPVFLIAGLWKTEDPGLGQIRLLRSEARRDLFKLLEKDYGRVRSVKATLDKLKDAQVIGPLPQRDAALLKRWQSTAETLASGLDHYSPSDVKQFDAELQRLLRKGHGQLQMDE